jgi:phospholipase C
MRAWRWRAAGLAALAGLLSATACGGTQTSGTVHSPVAVACGWMTGTTPHVRSVVVIMMENHAASVLDAMPRLQALSQVCAHATDYHAVAHPSLPNYIALTSGGIPAGIVHSDCSPGGACLDHGPSVFSEAKGSWRVWAESMRTPCQLTTAGRYAVRHTAAPYYTEVRAQCASRQIPLDEATSGLAAAIRSGRLPAFSLVVPNVTNDQHGGCVPCGDRFAARWATRIAASPEYRRGDVAVIVVWDEDDHSSNNHVPMVALSPYTRRGSVLGQPLTHYDLLRAIEDALGYPPLGAARTASPTLGRQLGIAA